MTKVHWIRREEPGVAGVIFYDLHTCELTMALGGQEAETPPANTHCVPLQAAPCAGALSAPLKAFLSITRGCDLDCPMCFARTKQGDRTQMKFQVVSRLLAELADLGVLEVRFTGGEPTLFPGFLELVAQADASHMNVSVNTHGAYDDLRLSQLVSSAIGEFHISLDGPAAIHDALRGVGTFERTVRAIQALRQTGKRVRINTMVFRENLDCLAQMLDLAENLGVGIRFCPMRPIGNDTVREFAHAHSLGQEQWIHVKDMLLKQAIRASSPVRYHSNAEMEDWSGCAGTGAGLEQAKCAAWLTQIGIDSEGDAYPGGCIDDIPKSLSVGSVADFSVRVLWARAIRDTHERLMRQFPQCAECRPTALWNVWRKQLEPRWAASNHLF